MWPIALLDILEVKFYYSCGDDRALNVRHYEVTSSVGAPAAQTGIAVANMFQSGFSNDLRAAMSADATFDSVTVQRLSPGVRSIVASSTGAAVAGLEPGAALPRQVAGLISLQTLWGGPANRGRWYMPYPDEGANSNNGAPTAAYQLLLAAIRTRITAPGIAGGAGDHYVLNPIILHRTTMTFTYVQNGIVRTRWATQRRRNNGRF